MRGELNKALLTRLRLEACSLEARHGFIEQKTNHLRNLRVVGYDLWREDDERHEQVRQEEPSGGDQCIRQKAARCRAPIHPRVLRSRAANAPSIEWRRGSAGG